jgi:hypothetical protein
MSEFYLRLALLALGSSMSPNLVGTSALLLNTSRPTRMLAAYGAGGYLFSVALGAFVALTASGLLQKLDSKMHLSPWVDLGAGLALIAFAVFRAVARREAHKPKQAGRLHRWIEHGLDRPRLWVAFLIGIATSLPGATYILALQHIAMSGKPTWEALTLIALFNVVAFTLVLIPVLLLIFWREEVHPKLRRANAWIERHLPIIVPLGAGALGLYLVAMGAYRLLR